MKLSYTFKIYQSKKQEIKFNLNLIRCKYIYNNQLEEKYGKVHRTIRFEDLKIQKNMVKNSHFVKSILDAGWLQLISFIKYKAEDKDKLVELEAP